METKRRYQTVRKPEGGKLWLFDRFAGTRLSCSITTILISGFRARPVLIAGNAVQDDRFWE